MPWGKFKGIRIRLIPVEYLSWLTTTTIMTAPQWRWLRDSILSELRFQGLNVEAIEAEMIAPAPEPVVETETDQVAFEFEESKFLLATNRRIQLE